MNRKVSGTLQFLFFLSTGIVLLYFAFRNIDPDNLLQHLRQARYGWVALSILCACMALVFRAFRWQLLIGPLGSRPKFSNILHAINVGYLTNFALPRIGEVTRCGVLNRTDKIPADRLFGTVIVERTFDLSVTFLMLCLILLIRFDVVSNFLTENIFIPMSEKMPGVISVRRLVPVAILIIVSFYFLYRIFKKQLAKIDALRKIRDVVKGIFNGIKSVSKIEHLVWFILLNLLVFGMYFLQTWLMFFSLDSTSFLSPVDALFILAVSSLSFIIPVQGGIGAYHWAVSLGLTVFGLTREEGMAYATLSHSTTTLLLVLLGTVSLVTVICRTKKTTGS
jgi:uncharacterized protein (TIRG00374 family)